jgi:hypothetical protein
VTEFYGEASQSAAGWLCVDALRRRASSFEHSQSQWAYMNKASTDPIQELTWLVTDGISTDIYLAFEAHGIFRTIGERASLADSSTYRPMLVAFQAYASAEFVLAVTRLLERQRTYELHSVHGVLMFLSDNARDIPVREPLWIQQSMERIGMWGRVPHEPGPAQTRAVVEALVSQLPHYTNSEALKALKDLRDKRIAHPERARPEGLPATSWAEALKLLDIPVEALGVCGAYMSVAYVDDNGRYSMNMDAACAGSAIRRLLDAARKTSARLS